MGNDPAVGSIGSSSPTRKLNPKIKAITVAAKTVHLSTVMALLNVYFFFFVNFFDNQRLSTVANASSSDMFVFERMAASMSPFNVVMALRIEVIC